MITCKQCGHENEHPVFHAIQFPVSPVPYDDKPPSNRTIPVRWACENCQRFHFKDGSLYDAAKAKALFLEDGA